MFCSINDFLWETQKLKSKSLLSLEKKETFVCAIFGKIYYVACAINLRWQIDLPLCLPARA